MAIRRFILFIVYAIIFFSSQCFVWVNWKDYTNNYDQAYYGLYLIVLLMAFHLYKRIKLKLIFGKIVLAIFLVSYPCCITLMVNGESLTKTIPHLLIPMAILLYFLFLKYSISEKSLLKCLFVFSFIILFLQVVQQVFPENAVFGIRDDELSDEVASMRNGIYRYLFPTIQITTFCMFYWWNRLLEKRTYITIGCFVLLGISLYLYLTRQMIFSAVFCLAFSGIIYNSQKVSSRLIVPFAFIFVIGLFFSEFFGVMVEDTREGGISTEYRLSAYSFYVDRILDGPLSFFCGNGHPRIIESWQDLHMHTSDIGFVGEVYHKGIFSFILYLILIYNLLIKYKKVIPFYIRLYVLCSFIASVMGFPYVRGLEYVLWAVIIYIAEKNIQLKNRETIYISR